MRIWTCEYGCRYIATILLRFLFQLYHCSPPSQSLLASNVVHLIFSRKKIRSHHNDVCVRMWISCDSGISVQRAKLAQRNIESTKFILFNHVSLSSSLSLALFASLPLSVERPTTHFQSIESGISYKRMSPTKKEECLRNEVIWQTEDVQSHADYSSANAHITSSMLYVYIHIHSHCADCCVGRA